MFSNIFPTIIFTKNFAASFGGGGICSLCYNFLWPDGKIVQPAWVWLTLWRRSI